MREAAFVKQNMKRWKEYEELLKARALAPGKKSEIFIQLTDDLAFAQTQYPAGETTRYLNHLSSQIHQQIYKNKKEESRRFITFWTRELPSLFSRLRRPLFYSFIITLTAFAIGIISTLGGHTFVRLFLVTYSRLESFKMGAKDGLKVVMGLMPVFTVAGFIESFITRYSTMPLFIKILIIGSSLFFIIFYFFVYPLRFQENGSKN